MVFCLYFYKEQGKAFSEQEICTYLRRDSVKINEEGNGWHYDNYDTLVYFSFYLNKKNNDSAFDPYQRDYPDFEYINLSFELNLIGPDFFGLEAFGFVESFINDLSFFVVNPQLNEFPEKYNGNELYENWAGLNQQICLEKYVELGLHYCPPKKTAEAWNYNFKSEKISELLGINYSISRIDFLELSVSEYIATFSLWLEHDALVLPKVDFVVISKNYEKNGKTVKEIGLCSYKTILNTFGNYLEDYNFEGLNNMKILHPEKAEKIKEQFNYLELIIDQPISPGKNSFANIFDIEKLVNVKPAK